MSPNCQRRDDCNNKPRITKYLRFSYKVLLFLLQRSLQYFTPSQFFSHFFLQVKGSSQTGQIFVGKCCFFIQMMEFRLVLRGGMILAFSIYSKNPILKFQHNRNFLNLFHPIHLCAHQEF